MLTSNNPSPDDRPPTENASAANVVERLRAAGCVFAEDEAQLLLENATSAEDLDRMLQRRVDGIPLEYILGWAEFCGLRIAVEPGVFVPRQRTALMVTEALAVIRNRTEQGPEPSVILDLCCGAGAVSAAIAAQSPCCEIYAADIDPIAVGCARRNLPSGAHTFSGDLFSALPASLRGTVDVLVANAPYVPTEALRLMPPEARLHEPASALDGGTDGLQILTRVITHAPRWLAPGGSLFVESGEAQGPRLVELMLDAGLLPRIADSEELGATVVIARLPAG